ncbi:MAG: Rrf2 family transcriptional regulator [Oscillospiraceae bacterium]|nr:Rrf2 family transcriptional regulator [Oscillospiraceae bacterium]
MRISARGKYALKMLIDLAENNDEKYISLNDISERQNISKKYLEQIVPMLVKPGIIRANRGNKGGYQLNKPAYACTVGEILRATDGELIPMEGLDYNSDNNVIYVFEGIHDTINQYVDSISLQDILEHHREYFDYTI